jgi:succinate-semialdehyde dehydrogenase/glutarate-semialdehyde dehydrogenase
LRSEEAKIQLDQLPDLKKAGAKIRRPGGKRALDKVLTCNLTANQSKRGEPTFMKNFCPVASFYRVKNEQEAIDLANDLHLDLWFYFTQKIWNVP